MNDMKTGVHRGGRLQIPRSRGAASGFLLIVLGVWGALIPFIGPYFDFAYTPDTEWTWTTARGWLEVLPGAATVVGGLILLRSGNRATAMFGGWLSVIAGAWFVVGRLFADVLPLGNIGAPVADTATMAAWLDLAYFYGLGAAIMLLGGMALGRLSVRSVRDVEYAQRPVAAAAQPQPMAQPQPTAETTTAAPPADRPRRGLGGLFGRRHTHAH
jgi:hypothetical protein